jgi:hypothetical protein
VIKNKDFESETGDHGKAVGEDDVEQDDDDVSDDRFPDDESE